MSDDDDEPPGPGMRRFGKLWVWDQDSPEFKAMLERSAAAARAIAGSPEERELMAWCEAAAAEIWAALDAEEERAGCGRPV